MKRVDALIAVVLFGAFFALGLPGLGAIEFFRHTEADRTLIAWEMLERSDYLVPHILGSVILTKPPIFYWIIAASIHLFGEASEWVARFPSLIAASALIAAQFIALRMLKLSQEFALASSLILATSTLVLNIGGTAEIDMVFGFFCTLSLYSIPFIVRDGSWRAALFGYITASIAFLTKGPPIVFFFGASMVLYTIYEFRNRRSAPLSRVILLNTIGATIFLAAVLFWLKSLADVVGWEPLQKAFEVEIYERVTTAPLKNDRSPFYYIGALLEGALPWTPFALLGIFALRKRYKEINDNARAILIFSLITTVSALLMLSVSAGRTARYIFPVYPFAVNLITCAILSLRGTIYETRCALVAFWLGILGLIATVVGIILGWNQVTPLTLAIAAFSIALVSIGGIYVGRSRRGGIQLFAVICILALCYRTVERTVYAELRNKTRSVKADAQAIDAAVPKGLPIYTAEIFERWVPFYLKQQNRVVVRYRNNMQVNTERAYLLLSAKDESWRINQLSAADPTLTIKGEYRTGPTQLILVELNSSTLKVLKPKEPIPTVPSLPFSDEAEWLTQTK